MLLFLIIDGVFFAMAGMGMFPAGGIAGQQVVGENGQVLIGDNMVDSGSDINIHGILSANNSITVWGIVAAVVATGIVVLNSRVGTPQIVGVVAFAIVFWGSYLGAMGVMGLFFMPAEIVGLLTGINTIFFVLAVIQLTTGFSTKIGE